MLVKNYLHGNSDHSGRSVWRLFAAVILLVGTMLAASESGWEKRVPGADRSRSNPLANDSEAVSAGAKLYASKCAKCHGENAEGKGHHPSLRSESVRQATPGELQWMIEHGNRWHHMPAFGSLPENQRWQLVSYLKSLPEGSK
jgi:mono/diheme cytochrome c family protein